MKFSTLMQILIKADMVADVTISADCEVEDLNLMDQDYREFGDHIVYFIDASEVGAGTAIPMCLLYKSIFPDYRAAGLRNSARIKETTSLAEVFRYVKLQLNTEPEGQIGYANIISKLVSGVPMKNVLAAAFSYTGNLFVAIDLSGKILEYSTPFYVDYPLWMKSIQQGYCDEILMDYIQSRRRRIHMPKDAELIDLYCRKTKMYILVARIRHNNITLGYFFALSHRPSFDSYTRKLLPLFAQKVKDNILWLKNMNEVDDYKAIMRTSILLDAAGGASPAETLLRSKISGIKFQKHMRVLAIRTTYSKDLNYYTQILLPALNHEGLRDCPCFLWHTSVICLLNTDGTSALSEENRSTLEALAARYHLVIGVSNVFSDISQFADCFEQARTALNFSNRMETTTGPFYFYLDYAFYVMLDRVDDETLLNSCCHPALELLARYDAKKGMELFNTLRVYTEAGFNKARAAQMLFIHRNTINYRIQQIEQLCGIDLSNENLLFTLQLSFRIHDYRKNHLES